MNLGRNFTLKRLADPLIFLWHRFHICESHILTLPSTSPSQALILAACHPIFRGRVPASFLSHLSSHFTLPSLLSPSDPLFPPFLCLYFPLLNRSVLSPFFFCSYVLCSPPLSVCFLLPLVTLWLLSRLLELLCRPLLYFSSWAVLLLVKMMLLRVNSYSLSNYRTSMPSHYRKKYV